MNSQPTHDLVASAHAEIHSLTTINAALLEALETAYSVLMDGRPDEACDVYMVSARRGARAAIAQAKGENNG